MLIFKLEGFWYLKNLFIIFILDGLLFDDEPIWEPLEWSMFQTWLLFLFIFTWASEVIFSSKYGSYTNRDKRVWIGLHKTYSLLQLWFIINIIFVTIFITLPFYYEITYSMSYIVLWWNWFNSIFFFKLISLFSLILFLITLLKIQIRWFSQIHLLIIFIFIFCIITYLLFFNFLIVFFSFFTDINEYNNTGWLHLNQITHGPLKWGYGFSSRDHFSYHKTSTVFWLKNDPLIAASMLFLNIFIFIFLFFFFIQTLTTIRIIISTNYLSFNNITMFYSSVKQFYYLLLFLLSLVLLSYLYQLIRFPFELYWFTKIFFIFKLSINLLYTLLTHFLINNIYYSLLYIYNLYINLIHFLIKIIIIILF